jgi:hypothetical protein
VILAEAQCHGSCNRKQKRSITHHWRNDARLVSSVGLALIGPAYLGANALWPLVNPTPCRSESSVPWLAACWLDATSNTKSVLAK